MWKYGGSSFLQKSCMISLFLIYLYLIGAKVIKILDSICPFESFSGNFGMSGSLSGWNWSHTTQSDQTYFFLSIFSLGTRLYTHPCVSVCVCVSVPHFQNSQRNLYWGQAGAIFYSSHVKRLVYSSHVQLSKAKCVRHKVPRLLLDFPICKYVNKVGSPFVCVSVHPHLPLSTCLMSPCYKPKLR